jgi:hydroxymethylpyrimidine/phosphomethylpyrimidine kinase
MQMAGRVLVVSASDCSGCSGVQADIKTITALGGYAATAVTAVVVQNTQSIEQIHPLDPALVQRQIASVLNDIGADVIKLGLMHDGAMINAVSDVIEDMAPDIPLILDPVLVTKTGVSQVAPGCLRQMKIRLMPITTLLTPSIPEAQLLAGMDLVDRAQRLHLVRMLLTLGPKAVLLKGGSVDPSDPLEDLLSTEDEEWELPCERLTSPATLGAGGSFSAAIACGLAQGMTLPDATKRAQAYIIEAIRAAPGFGAGLSPINHAITATSFPP